MPYIENPKTKGSGILCCIPQRGRCPNECEDCFFQSGRSYLEPLEDNLPNMPPDELARGRVVRVNDGNDSRVNREMVMQETARYPMRFYNTSSPEDLAGYDAPVVLTVNPGRMTDIDGWGIKDPPRNLMFVRIRTNTWNLELVRRLVESYTIDRSVPVVLTFMAYFEYRGSTTVGAHRCRCGDDPSYTWRKRTLNSYYAITTEAWRRIMGEFEDNALVHSCGKIEGERGTTACRHCGNCLREYFATMERMRQ